MTSIPCRGGSRGVTHPSVFLALYLPFGIANGYVIVTLAYLLPPEGLSISQVAGVIALLYLPQTWKVLWAPIVDTTLSIRRWYVIGAGTTGTLILAMTLVPARASQLWLLDVLVFLTSLALSIAGMATENLMAHNTSAEQKGRAGGWCQAGGLGGQGLGGGAGLWLSQHVSAWSGGALLALVCLGCCGALWAVPVTAQPSHPLGLGARLAEAARDVWSVARSRTGFLAALLVFMPLGTAAASNLWSAIAGDWHADADTVALVNGLLSGLITAGGCLVGGYLFDLMNRKAGYVLSGLTLAACALAMGLAPRNPMTFMIFVSLYGFFTGWVYGAFTALALETIGTGAAATKYNMLACLSNIPITYMTLVDGAARTHFGPAAMLFTEAGIAVLASLVFGSVALATRRGPAHAPLQAGGAS
ncbi:MAG TPA: MFS transporter [Steroidobacteraceae bacterium]|jgi:MFS family permease|nr:MFS transporter [Steroidobacteraceae bacterium]